MPLIETASFTLSVDTYGAADSDRLALVIPGWLDSKKFPHMIAHSQFMADHDFHAVSFDPPGTWDSPGDIELYSVTNYLKAITEVIEFYGNLHTVIVGQSMGGRMALLAAAQNANVIATASLMSTARMNVSDLEKRLWKEDGHITLTRDNPLLLSTRDFTLDYSYFEDASTYSVYDVTEALTIPKLMIAGMRDELASVHSVKNLYGHCPDPKEYIEVDCIHDYWRTPGDIELVNNHLDAFFSHYINGWL